ncbi:hypothetical protein ACQVVZ_25670 [Bacillus pretiosus]
MPWKLIREMSWENRLILVREEELRKISVFDSIGVVFVPYFPIGE